MSYIFSQGYSLLFFSILLIYGGLAFGVLGLGSWIGFLGLEFSVDEVLGLWCGAFWVLWGWDSLYKHKRITAGKTIVQSKTWHWHWHSCGPWQLQCRCHWSMIEPKASKLIWPCVKFCVLFNGFYLISLAAILTILISSKQSTKRCVTRK